MISRNGNQNFFVAHYDWIVVGVGVLALAAGAAFFGMSAGDDPEELAMESAAQVDRMKPAETGVKPVDMSALQDALRATRSPKTVTAISEKDASFLASERRVLCAKCKKAIIGDVRICPACPYCGEKQQEEVKVVLDADQDGMPDEWEKRFGLNPGSAVDAGTDADGDGFTNLEEFLAKTDPTDPKDHPDYLDSVKILLPLKETKMPFVFTKATQIPGGWRCEFLDPSRKNDYGQRGRKFSAKVGEGVIDASSKQPVDYGFTVKSYTQKSDKRKIKGSELMKDVDVSEVVLERKSDGKQITLTIQSGKAPKLASLDVQATIAYERGTVQNFDVVQGSEIELNGTRFKVAEIKTAGKGAKVVFENALTGRKRTIDALEP